MTDLRAALDAAHTPLPWHCIPSIPEQGVNCMYLCGPAAADGWRIEIGAIDGPQGGVCDYNAALIVAAVNAAPALLAEVEALKQKLDENAMPDDWIALTAERDTLKEIVSGWIAENSPGGWIDNLRNAEEARRIELEAVRVDAERWQALSRLDWYVGPDTIESTEGGSIEGYCNENISQESLNAAIDAARGQA